LLKLLAALALLVSPASADQVISLEWEIVRVIRVALNTAPWRSWDELRVAMPQTVRWHLAPPDERGTPVILRSGWISMAGRQAGVAACGSLRGPELLALRMHDGMAPTVMRSCEVTYLLGVRPDYRSAAIAQTCRAP
jgi:hypothetical protein